MAGNAIIRQRVEELQAQGKEDREWWDKKRASIQTDFMKELDEGAAASRPNISRGEKVGSDEDAVMVEGGGTMPSGSAAGSKGDTKKRKGKK